MDELIEKAALLSAFVHVGQKDKAGKEYYYHPKRVASHVTFYHDSYEAIIVAYLHDVLEDYPGSREVMEDVIEVAFGVEVLDAVQDVSHSRYESRDTYYARVKQNPLALAVKLADIDDNMDPDRLNLLDPCTRERLVAKYIKARRFLLEEE